MKIPKIILAIGYIDEDLIANAACPPKRSIKPIVKYASLAACFCLCIVLVAVALPLLTLGNPSQDGTSDDGTAEKINVSDTLIITGEEFAISDEEAYAYLQSTKSSIIQTLNACGVGVSSLTFTPKGYSPIHTGDHGNSLALDWRTFLAFEDDRLVAILEISKDEKGLHPNLAFGGQNFHYYKQLLDTYKGCELVFLYIGNIVAFITPDNTVVPTNDLDLSDFIEAGYPYYQFFKTPYNTFVP